MTERDELTFEEKQLMFEELMRKKAQEEEEATRMQGDAEAMAAQIWPEHPLKTLIGELKVSSANEAASAMRMVDAMSGGNVGIMLRNSLELLLTQIAFVKQLTLAIVTQERIFEETPNVPNESFDRSDNSFDSSRGLDEPETVQSGGPGQDGSNDNR